MKINVEVDFKEILGEAFEEWITTTYYEPDTGYVEKGEVPEISEIIYQQASQELFNRLIGSLNFDKQTLTKRLLDNAKANAKQLLDDEVQDFARETLETFRNKTILEVQSSGWSSEVTEVPIDSYIEKKLDSLFKNKMFDEKGKPNSDSYGRKYSMMELMIDEHVQKVTKQYFSETYKDEINRMQKLVRATIREELTENYLNNNRVEEIAKNVYQAIEDDNKKVMEQEKAVEGRRRKKTEGEF